MSSERLQIIHQHINPKPLGSPGTLNVHILDTVAGLPATGLKLTLFRLSGTNNWTYLTEGLLNEIGKCPALKDYGDIPIGIYKMRLGTGDFYRRRDLKTFYPYVEVSFKIDSIEKFTLVPVLLSPYGFTTYRGN